MNKLLLLALPLTLTLTAALAPTETTIRFAPEEGLSLTKTFESRTSAELEELLFEMGGEEVEIPEIPEISIRTSETLVFEDTYDAVEEGRPTRLSRSFQELGRSRSEDMPGPEGERVEVEGEESSELVDTVVIFTWDEDEEEYTAEYDEDADGDEELLDGLFADADLLGFLPEGEVAEGDTWEADIDAFHKLFNPGGDLTFLDEEGESTRTEIDEDLEESMEGEIECELEGVEDGLAIIAITLEVEGMGDIETELEGDGEMVDDGVQLREISVESEYEGAMVWDLEAGHLVSIELVGEAEVSILEKVTLNISTGDSFEQAQTMIFTSETELEITFE